MFGCRFSGLTDGRTTIEFDYTGTGKVTSRRSHQLVRSNFLNTRYSRHFRITNRVGFKSFLFVINPNTVSLFNIFNTIVFIFECRFSGLTDGQTTIEFD